MTQKIKSLQQLPIPNSSFENVIDLFERQVLINPDKPALIFENTTLTYAELNDKANKVAQYLKEEFGVREIDTVAIWLNRSEKLIIAILGILKTGAAYLPIDESLPPQRVEFMLQDSKACAIVTESDFIFNIPSFSGNILAIDVQLEMLNFVKEWNSRISNGSPIAYVIYTSGTAGLPKGVLIEHKSLVDYVHTIIEHLSITPSDSILQQGSIGFDLSIEEIFPILCSGGKLVVSKDNRNFFSIIKDTYENKITILSVTRGYVKLMNKSPEIFNKELSTLRILVTGGEPHFASDICNIYNKVELYNSYGPTESTVCATYYKVIGKEKNADPIPIGRPLKNRSVLILDKFMKLVPIGVIGEIYIGGVGLAKGYLNLPELTSEKFIPNPYQNGHRLYRTGDLGMWMSDGNIQFVGRIDSQVKLRGNRIELSEIEKHINKIEDIQEAIVLLNHQNEQNPFLVAYIVSIKTVPTNEIRDFARQFLPEYMIPSAFVYLESLPYTANGKIDKDALLHMNIKEGSLQVSLPITATERGLSLIWGSITGQKIISRDDNFFALGGNSLSAVEVITQVYNNFHRELTLQNIFNHPILSQLAVFIDDQPLVERYIIPRQSTKEYYSASPSQVRMYILQQLDKESTAYNMPGLFKLKHGFDENLFVQALQGVIKQNEILRTHFGIVSDQVVQFVSEDCNVEIRPIKEISGSNISAFVQTLIKPFNLNKGPLLRLYIISTLEKDRFLFFDIHHSIFDGISYDLLILELFSSYKGGEIPGKHLQYKDYADWIYNLYNNGSREAHRHFWLDYLQGEWSPTELTTDFPRPAIASNNGTVVKTTLDSEQSIQIRTLAKRSNSSVYMLMLAAFNCLLHKYTQSTDIIIGTPVSGRLHPDTKNIIGLFVNTVVIRNPINPAASFSLFLASVKDNLLGVLSHQEYPFDDLVRDLKLEKDLSRNPIFQIFLTYDEKPLFSFDYIRDLFEPLTYTHTNSKFDLTLNISEREDSFDLNFIFNTDLFHIDTIVNLKDHFVNLLKSIILDEETTISKLEIFSADQIKEQTEYLQTSDSCKIPAETICSLFENLCKRNSKKNVVVSSGKKLTCGEIQLKSDAIARFIVKELPVEKRPIVLLHLNASPLLYTLMLGIMKAKAAFLIVEDNIPIQRLNYILSDSEAGVFITDQSYNGNIKFDGKFIYAEFFENLNLGDFAFDLPIVTPNDAAYVIYTSGSTGEPKGVVVKHSSLVNYVNWLTEIAAVGCNDKTMLISSAAFDHSYTGIFSSLAMGVELHFTEKHLVLEPQKFFDYIREEKISFIKMTPSVLSLLIAEGIHRFEDFRFVKLLIIGGEQLNYKNTQNLLNHFSGKILYHYGPTEATIGCITNFITKQNIETYRHNCVIGRPIFNTHVIILGIKSERMMPIGAAGEICISGACLAQGYLNMPGLTLEKFINHPYKQGMVLYRTGDLGRTRKDGSIEFLGRIDDQLKIRGYRVSTIEIIQTIAQFEGVKNVIVLPERDENEVWLVAFIVPKSGAEIPSGLLRHFLLQRLPEYMVPRSFISIPNLPVTSNGKVDLKQLPRSLSKTTTTTKLIFVDSPQLQAIRTEWSHILHLDISTISATKNFFELGGDSLRAVRLANAINKQFGVLFSLKDVFDFPTLEAQAMRVLELDGKYSNSIPVANLSSELYPLSHAQLRLWILNEISDAGIAYNIPVTLHLKGTLDFPAFKNAYMEIIKRHETFRTVFINTVDGPKQKIIDIKDLELKIVINQIPGRNLEFENGNILLSDLINKKFNLSEWPLFSINLYQINEEEYYLFIVFHHIITDGWSSSILIDELKYLYSQFKNGKVNELPSLKIQYKDYVIWHEELIKNDQKAKKYWNEKLSLWSRESLRLTTDFPRPANKTFNGETIVINIDKAVCQELEKFMSPKGNTLYTVLLTSIQILLYLYSKQKTFIIGVPFAGRNHSDLENQIGMYVNTLPLLLEIQPTDTIYELFNRTGNTLLEALDHQHYPFDKIIEDLQLPSDASRSRIFDVAVLLQNFERSSLNDIEGLQVSPILFDYPGSKFDMMFTFNERSNNLELHLEFNSDLFSRKKVEKIALHFQSLLRFLTSNPTTFISEIEYLPEEEKRNILDISLSRNTLSPGRDTIVDYIRHKSLKFPDTVALVDNHRVLSYSELQQLIDQWGALFSNQYNIGHGEIVALIPDTSFLLVPTLLGILSIGAIYFIIDENDSSNRITQLLNTVKPNLIIVNKGRSTSMSVHGETVSFEELAKKLESISSSLEQYTCVTQEMGSILVPCSTLEGDLTTTVISHMQLVNAGLSVFENISMDKVVFPIGPVAAYSVQTIIWGALLNSNKLILDTKNHYTNDSIKKTKELYLVNVLFLDVDRLKQILDKGIELFITIDVLIVSGELIMATQIEKLQQAYKNISIISFNGPPESLGCAFFQIIPITGNNVLQLPVAPAQNTTTFVLDNDKKLMPLGFEGNIYMSGVIFDNANLSKTKTKQYYSNNLLSNSVLFETGYQGFWRYDNYLQITNFNENQLCITGFSFSPREIEKILRQLSGENHVKVLKLWTEQEKPVLSAFIKSENPKVIDVNDLRDMLEMALPSYMVPEKLIIRKDLPAFGETQNDKSIQLLLEQNEVEETNFRIINDTEKKLLSIRAEVLGIKENSIGLDDNFFEISGHSLLAIRLIAKINSVFDIDLDVKQVFDNPTIRKLAILMDGAIKSPSKSSIPKLPTFELYNVSHGQLRMWILNKFRRWSNSYKIFDSFYVRGNLELKSLKLSINDLVSRHESLRTVFVLSNGALKQKILPIAMSNRNIRRIDISETEENSEERLVRIYEKVIRKKFDLEHGPLFQVYLIKKASNEHVIIIRMHHIISDAWSNEVIINDLAALYLSNVSGKGNDLPQLDIQYKDFAAWQNSYILSTEVAEQKEYWKKQLKGNLPVIVFNNKNARVKKGGKGISDSLDWIINKELAQQAAIFGETKNVTQFALFLSVLKLVIGELSGMKDIIIGIPSSLRNKYGLQNQVGFYINSLPIRSQLNPVLKFEEFVESVKRTILKGMENQDYPFDMMLEDINTSWNSESTPIYNIMFSFNNEAIGITDIQLPELTIKRFRPDIKNLPANFDLLLIINKNTEGELIVSWIYDSGKIEEDIVHRMASNFVSILQKGMENAKTLLSELFRCII